MKVSANENYGAKIAGLVRLGEFSLTVKDQMVILMGLMTFVEMQAGHLSIHEWPLNTEQV